jgi:hypothetical protein
MDGTLVAKLRAIPIFGGLDDEAPASMGAVVGGSEPDLERLA